MNNDNDELVIRLNNLLDIDSDSDIENPTEHNELLDKLTLECYPDPFNTIGQFIMSAINGASVSYLIKLKESKQTDYISDINIYFRYCKNSPDDSYIQELSSKLKLNTVDNSDNIRLHLIIDQINKISIDLMVNFIKLNKDLFEEYRLLSNAEFDIDIFNANLLKRLIPMIKYSLISNISFE